MQRDGGHGGMGLCRLVLLCPELCQTSVAGASEHMQKVAEEDRGQGNALLAPLAQEGTWRWGHSYPSAMLPSCVPRPAFCSVSLQCFYTPSSRKWHTLKSSREKKAKTSRTHLLAPSEASGSALKWTAQGHKLGRSADCMCGCPVSSYASYAQGMTVSFILKTDKQKQPYVKKR